jgi:hypothetical protein
VYNILAIQNRAFGVDFAPNAALWGLFFCKIKKEGKMPPLFERKTAKKMVT